MANFDDAAIIGAVTRVAIQEKMWPKQVPIDQSGWGPEIYFFKGRHMDPNGQCLSPGFALFWMKSIQAYVGIKDGKELEETVRMQLCLPYSAQSSRQFNNRENNLWWPYGPIYVTELQEAYYCIRNLLKSPIHVDAEKQARFIACILCISWPSSSTRITFRDIFLFLYCSLINGKTSLDDLESIMNETMDAWSRLDYAIFKQDCQYHLYFALLCLQYLKVLVMHRLLDKPDGILYFRLLKQYLKSLTGLDTYSQVDRYLHDSHRPVPARTQKKV